MAKCTAGDRDWCSIDCDSGRCLAYYSEPSGPCVRVCLDSPKAKSLSISLTERFSLGMHDARPAEVQRIFENLSIDILKVLKEMSDEDGITVTVADGTMADLFQEIRPKETKFFEA
jgi:hypothetical protein